jgi:hypothetical protein
MRGWAPRQRKPLTLPKSGMPGTDIFCAKATGLGGRTVFGQALQPTIAAIMNNHVTEQDKRRGDTMTYVPLCAKPSLKGTVW